MPEDINLSFDKIKNTSLLCWPYITTLEDIYFNGESIEYYNEITARWVKGTIIKINTEIPTTYNISINTFAKKI